MNKSKKFFQKLGPGFVTGASDDDPSGIGTYSQTGAAFGYSQLWTALFTFPFMAVVQEMCGRIGMVTGKGLSGVIRKHYPTQILYLAVLLLVVANTINIGADLGAMAASASLVIPLPFAALLLIITFFTLLLEIFVSYKTYSRYLKYLALSLVVYVVAALTIKQDWRQILFATIIPNVVFSKEYLLNIVAILGTTISPYLFFWQASEEVEEEVATHKLMQMGHGNPKINKKDIRQLRVDTISGMFFSNIIMFFIISTTAATLFNGETHGILTANMAAESLRPLVGDGAFLLFCLGIIGTGLLAIPVLAGSASYALSEAFGWKEGLYKKFTRAHGFYGVITLATILGLLINYTSIPAFTWLYYAAIINGVCAAPLLLVILLISNNPKIMGKFTNTKLSNAVGVVIAAIMSICAILLAASLT